MRKRLIAIVLTTLAMPCAWMVYAQSTTPSEDAAPVVSSLDETDAVELAPARPAQPALPLEPPRAADTPQPPRAAAQPRRAGGPPPSDAAPTYNRAERRNSDGGNPEARPNSGTLHYGYDNTFYSHDPLVSPPRGIPGLPGPAYANPPGFAQDPNRSNVPQHTRPGAMVESDGRLYRMTTKPRTVLESHAEEISAEDRERYEEFVKNVNRLRNSETSTEDRQAARETIEKLVSAEIDRDLEQREKQLAEIEAKAKQLREQLDKRRAAKSDMLNMNMMMIENPSTGLGLPAEWMQSLMPPQVRSFPEPTRATFGTDPFSTPPAQLNNPPRAILPRQGKEEDRPNRK